jgi:PLATZ transcription factor
MKRNHSVTKAEQRFYQQTELQNCVVCGRPFIRRPDRFCSINCKEVNDETDAVVGGD